MMLKASEKTSRAPTPEKLARILRACRFSMTAIWSTPGVVKTPVHVRIGCVTQGFCERLRGFVRGLTFRSGIVSFRDSGAEAHWSSDERRYDCSHGIAEHRWFRQRKPALADGHDQPCKGSPACRDRRASGARGIVAQAAPRMARLLRCAG